MEQHAGENAQRQEQNVIFILPATYAAMEADILKTFPATYVMIFIIMIEFDVHVDFSFSFICIRIHI